MVILLFKDIFTKLTYDAQEVLVQETVDNELVVNLPLKITYQKEFLKFIISALERRAAHLETCNNGDKLCDIKFPVSAEIHDSVYDSLGRLVALPDSSGEFFKHYEWESGKVISQLKVISLKEEANFISSGTTGLCTWTVRKLGLINLSIPVYGFFFRRPLLLEIGVLPFQIC